MAKKKTSGASFRNGDLFCYNCGRGYKMNLPQPVSMASAMMIQFDKDHRNCPKTWEPPVVDQSLSEKNKAMWWMTHGERGMSSEAIWNRLIYTTDGMVNLDGQKKHHPSDADDFRRCYLLLETVPEWKEKLHLLKDLSPVWSKLVDKWGELTEMLLEQMAGKKNNMYELMKSLGC
jgi:hypothetical protein